MRFGLRRASLGILTALSIHVAGGAAAAFPPQVGEADVQTAIAAAPKQHPRLLATGEQLRNLPQAAKAGPTAQAAAGHIVAEATRLLDEAPVTRTLEGRRLLGQSRACLSRVLHLAAAYYITGRADFAGRAEKEMLAASAFSDWNPAHYLDVAEMTLGLAVGYEWRFDTLAADSRRTIRQAIVEKALRLPFVTGHGGWVKASNNWGQVCHAGMVGGALAVLEDEPELAARTVLNALGNVHHSMHAFAPEGSYPEGPGYWSYGAGFNVLLIACLESVLGSDFGLCEAPGFSRTGAYLPMVTGPSGLTFNYADGGSGRGPEPVLFWFADRFDRNDWLKDEYDLLRREPSRGGRLLPLALLWMNESAPMSEIRMPLHWNTGGEVPICIHRSAWGSPQAVFVGFKGGSPSANHGHMDVGSFVLDADGIRWALDLGAEGYHRIESRGMNLWSRDQNSERWPVFRLVNASHNTLVIDGQNQSVKGFGKVVAFSDRPERAHSVIDMSSAYAGQVGAARRGVALLPAGCVVVQDELGGLKPGAQVRWGMVTRARPGETGSDRLQLAERGKSLELRILKPAGASWKTVDIETPRNEWDSPNPGATMVATTIVAPPSGDMTIVIVARPGGATAPDVPPRPLAEW